MVLKMGQYLEKAHTVGRPPGIQHTTVYANHGPDSRTILRQHYIATQFCRNIVREPQSLLDIVDVPFQGVDRF